MGNFRDSLTRRTFLKGTAAATAGAAWLGPASFARAEGGDKLRIAAIGVGNTGWSGIEQLNSHPDVAINALVDVDQKMLESTTKKGEFVSPLFHDFRELFAKKSDIFDAVYIATPDHMHAPIAMMALDAEKHVYTEAPLTKTVGEAKAIGVKSLDKFSLITQLGVPSAALPHKRFAVAQLRSGTIGPINAIHAFTDQPTNWWAHGAGYGKGEDATPENLKWDLWLGGAEKRPYQKGLYHPGAWKGNVDFGTGAIGLMGCHILETAFLAMGLTHPSSVIAQVKGAGDHKYPDQSKITYHFEPGRRTASDGMTLTWYDGGLTPDKSAAGIANDYDLKPNSLILVGEEGTMVVGMDEGFAIFKDGKLTDAKVDEGLTPRNHYYLWVDACMGFGECDLAFGVGSRLTETVLLGGTVAARVPGEKLEYDGNTITNNDKANALLTTNYRQGWAVPGL